VALLVHDLHEPTADLACPVREENKRVGGFAVVDLRPQSMNLQQLRAAGAHHRVRVALLQQDQTAARDRRLQGAEDE
jgi:hypothetical protein